MAKYRELSPRDRRALSRELSRLAGATVAEAIQAGESAVTTIRRVGITGPPGVGKSSLIARLAPARLEKGPLAIIAVDPTSPVSGGAILGDRVRMDELSADPRFFIRSLASRESHDGLTDNLPLVLDHLGKAGFAEVIVETVGVGQVEYDISQIADTVVLALMPGTGDFVQAMKSGILERADIVVVNKADQPGLDRLVADLKSVLRSREHASGAWQTPIIATSAKDAAGTEALNAAIGAHQAWLAESGRAATVQRQRRLYHAGSLIRRRLGEVLAQMPKDSGDGSLAAIYDGIVAKLAVQKLK